MAEIRLRCGGEAGSPLPISRSRQLDVHDSAHRSHGLALICTVIPSISITFICRHFLDVSLSREQQGALYSARPFITS
jgi:hypothetical protein